MSHNVYTSDLNNSSYRQLSKLSIAKLSSHTTIGVTTEMIQSKAYTAHQKILIERLYHQLKAQRSATR